jgi:hypothetical protein
MRMTPEIQAGIESLIERATAARLESFNRTGGVDVQGSPQLHYTAGPKYARVYTAPRGVPQSAYCFVDLANGDILKAAGWASPARGSRGNVLSEVPMQFDAHGGCFYRR